MAPPGENDTAAAAW